MWPQLRWQSSGHSVTNPKSLSQKANHPGFRRLARAIVGQMHGQHAMRGHAGAGAGMFVRQLDGFDPAGKFLFIAAEAGIRHQRIGVIAQSEQ
jgi:hypothetical protein